MEKWSDIVMGNRGRMQSSSQAEASKIVRALKGLNVEGFFLRKAGLAPSCTLCNGTESMEFN